MHFFGQNCLPAMINREISIPEFLFGERVSLWRPELGSGAALFDAVSESLKELRQYPSSQPWALTNPSVSASEEFCRRAATGHTNRTDLPYFIYRAVGGDLRGRLVGCCGLHRPNWQVPSFEIGYWCRASEMRKGFATDAARILLHLALNTFNAQRVVITTDHCNVPSRKVAERIGMQLEGVLRNFWREPGGKLRDACIYSAIPATNSPPL